jgi:S1-C subfamily serine protease
VWVVGNPNGLDATVVEGVVSSTNRAFEVEWAEPGEKLPFIQFSGGVWYGNSGGSLYNDEGYLIGVPGVIAGTAHLGLAIPINEVRVFLRESCFARVMNPQQAGEDKRCEAERAKQRERWENPGNGANSSVSGSRMAW